MRRWYKLLNLNDWLERRRVFADIRALELQESYAALDGSNPLHLAKISLQVGDVIEASRRWDQACVSHPVLVRRSPDSITILLGLKRFDEAEALIASCKQEFPGDSHYAEGYSLVPQSRGDIAEALGRWRKAQRRFPAAWRSYVEEAVCLCLLGKAGEADRLLTNAIRMFPEQLHIWIQWGRVSDAQSEWNQSAERWQSVADKFQWPGGIIGKSRALVNLGNPTEALSVLTDAKDKFRSDPDLQQEIARLSKAVNQTNSH